MIGILKNNKLAAIFAVCFIYWGYLFFASHMDISMDAVSYEAIGKIISQEGWEVFLRNGPNREPLYPSLVALSMVIAQKMAVPYQYIQKGFQIGILFLTQLLMLVVLKRLNIPQSISYLVILYLGFSPGVVNSVFSLYSEIVSFPFVLAYVLLNAFIWEKFKSASLSEILILGVLSGFFYFLATFTKGIFLFLMISTLAVYFFAGIFQREFFIKTFAYILATFALFQSFFIPYKWLNKKYNDNYVYTTRFEPLFYANVVKRTVPMTKRIVWAHLAFIPGEGVCRKYFTQEECDYCGLQEEDRISGLVLPKFLDGLTKDEGRKKTMAMALDSIRQKPFHYVFFSVIESLRMFFWESTRIGFVKYPEWLGNIYSFKLFKDGLRFTVSVITLWAFGCFCVHAAANLKTTFSFNAQKGNGLALNFFILWGTVVFVLGYSVVTVLTRYALPLVPLYLIMIAFVLNKTFLSKI